MNLLLILSLAASLVPASSFASEFPMLECKGRDGFRLLVPITRDDGGVTVLGTGQIRERLGVLRTGVTDRTASDTGSLEGRELLPLLRGNPAGWSAYRLVYWMPPSNTPLADQDLILPVKPSRLTGKGMFKAAIHRLPEMANPFIQLIDCRVTRARSR